MHVFSNDSIEDAVKSNGVRWFFADRTDPSRIGGRGNHEHIIVEIETLKMLAVKTASSDLNSISRKRTNQTNLQSL